MRVYPLGKNREVEIPADWAEELGLSSVVRLEKTPEGILIRPTCQTSWDDLFLEKLQIGSQSPSEDELEVRSDDLLL